MSSTVSQYYSSKVGILTLSSAEFNSLCQSTEITDTQRKPVGQILASITRGMVSAIYW